MAEAIEIGGSISHYRVVSKIGEGGMGEVYLAEDTELGRQVALKVLLSEVAGDEERVRRFVQEAKAASALNHPNILTVYEIGTFEDSRFIATELIKGETLRDRLRGEPLTLREVLDVAMQAAAALNAAHSAGIVHRDIKPENIMLRDDGFVKVLDFGLAKLAFSPTGAAESEDATRAQVNTKPGVIMGTVQYMSPEQARGKETDARCDIWSLGVVMHEMLTKRTPFAGETANDSIAAILTKDPPPLDAGAPSELQRIIRKSLQKNADERYQTVKDMLLDVKNLKRELEISDELERSQVPHATGSANVGTSQMAENAATTHSGVISTQISMAQQRSSAEYLVGEIQRHKKGALIIGAVVLIAVAVLGVGIYRFVTSKNQTKTQPTGTGVSSNMKITRLTTTGRALEAAISPDGKWVVYVQKDGGQRSLWLRQTATNNTIQIVPSADVSIGRETFSPDGNYVYYYITDANNPAGVLYQASTIGGTPRKILTNIGSPITFSPDGRRFAFIRNDEVATGEDQLIVANTDGTGERKLAVRKVDEWFPYPGGCGWSPDGLVIACSAGKYKGGFQEIVLAVDAETGEQKEFTSAEFSDMGRVSWVADGSGIVVNAAERKSYFDQLWFISYPGGESHKITNDLNTYGGTSLTADSQSLVTVQEDTTENIWIAPSGDMARAKQITYAKFEGGDGMAWTPDGRIVYTSRSSGNANIWIMNSDGSGQKQLAADPANATNPRVAPDGRYIVFVSSRHGLPSLWRMDIDGGNLKRLTDQEDYLPQISPDGKWVVFDSWRSGRRALWKVSIDGGQPVQISDKFTSSAGISPDGKWIACFYRDEEQPNTPWRIMILPFEGGQPLKTFAAPGTDQMALDAAVAWTPDGRAITYVDSTGESPNLWSQSLDGGPPKKLTEFKENGVWRYALSRDGKQLALTRGTVTSDVVLIKDFR